MYLCETKQKNTMISKTSIVSKTKVGNFFTYKINGKIFKKKSKVDYQFCCICQNKESEDWGYLGFSRSESEANKVCEQFKHWTSLKNVQVVEIISIEK